MSAPATGMTLSGWARTPSAATTPSSGSAARPGHRSRSSPAAITNKASSVPAIAPAVVANSRGTCAKPVTRPAPPTAIRASQALAAAPSSEARSAHGAGSGTGNAPLYCRARPRPARPPSATESPANSSQRATAVSQTMGIDSRADTPSDSRVVTGKTVAACAILPAGGLSPPAEPAKVRSARLRFGRAGSSEQATPDVPRADGPKRDAEQDHGPERAERHPLEERPGHAPAGLDRIGLAEQRVDGTGPEQGDGGDHHERLGDDRGRPGTRHAAGNPVRAVGLRVQLPQPHQRREDEEVADRGRGHGERQHDGEEVGQLAAGEQEHQEYERRRDDPRRDVDG